MGRSIHLDAPPKRIISLVPSQTELLYDLGLEEEVIGITKFCVHPRSWFKSKLRVGGTKSYKFDIIRELQPDLIIGNKEENDKVQVEALMQDYPVWMSDIYTLEDALEMIRALGAIVQKEQKAKSIRQQIEVAFQQYQIAFAEKPKKKVAYFIWRKPNMVAGQHTFINEMLYRAGFDNVFHDLERYPSIDDQLLKEKSPDLILLSSEPFPFKEKHIQEFKEICPSAVIRLVDGEVFSWYGSRLLHSIPYFRTLRKDINF